MVGVFREVKVLGVKFSFKNFTLYHLGAGFFGVSPVNMIIAYIKKKIRERY